ncbi:hypothetical protein [Aquitalea denitrificans]|uniref:hypothetical protein n=1 Tax=Aquitalea denitrificans TaxID=519081 RepID=UPI00135C6BAB|nr:hypothetical protein [Aquitalea denitrificans]
MDAAQRHASTPAYAAVPLATPPRIWPCLLLSVVLVAGDALLTLWWFSQGTPSTAQREQFWWYALLPGCLLAGIAVSLRLAWYALWQLYAAVQQHTQAEHHTWWLRCRQESASVRESMLWGPACGDTHSRDRLARGLHAAPPQAKEGVLRIVDVLSVSPASWNDRQNTILATLAKALATWLHGNPIQACGFAWCGSAEAWSGLRVQMQQHGLNLPPHPQLEGGVAMLEYIIDRLHDETRPVEAIICLGLHCPASDASRSVPAAEAAFAIMLSRHGGAFRLHRPVPLSDRQHVQRTQDNAALDEAPAGYLSASGQANALLEDAGWPLLEQAQQAYWGELGPLQAWVTLLCAMDQANLNERATGWLAKDNEQDWLGIVTPAVPLAKGKP